MCDGMETLRGAWPEAVAALVSNATFVVSWQVGLVTLEVLVTCGAWRLLDRRQRQAALREVLACVSAGTVVVYEDGPAGQRMQIWSNEQPGTSSASPAPSQGSS